MVSWAPRRMALGSKLDMLVARPYRECTVVSSKYTATDQLYYVVACGLPIDDEVKVIIRKRTDQIQRFNLRTDLAGDSIILPPKFLRTITMISLLTPF